jgi:ankyrin repeat protein
VEYLIKVEKAGDDSAGLTGCTFLAHRAKEGRIDLVQMLLEHSIDVTSSSDTWAIPLRFAIIGGHVDVVQAFLESGVDLTPRNGFSDPSICFAASQGNEKILDLMIKHGADVNTRDLLGRTLLSLAKGHKAACRLLIDHNAKAE